LHEHGLVAILVIVVERVELVLSKCARCRSSRASRSFTYDKEKSDPLRQSGEDVVEGSSLLRWVRVDRVRK
jgi:hypothetical protein